MATDPRYAAAHDGHRAWEDIAVAEDHEGWVARSRVMLTPIAAPSIMGLFGFTMATVMLGAYQAGWYGSAITPLVSWPLALFALTAAGTWAGSLGTVNADGWLFVASAAAAWLTAGSMVLEHSYGRSIIPVGKWSKHANIPGAKVTDPIAYPAGMPGVKIGQ